jgi:hypothetical protein
MRQTAEGRRRFLATRLLRAEAATSLLAARLALALFSFHRLTRFFNRSPARPEPTGPERDRIRKEVQGAIFHARRTWSLKTTCLHRAMAAQAMLRRRGVGATLYYGAATLPGRGLRTHAWVQDGETGVVGLLVAQRDGYQVLARYPE